MSQPEQWPGGLSLAFLEGLYRDYLRDPNSVGQDWRGYFDALPRGDGGTGSAGSIAALKDGPSFQPQSIFHMGSGGSGDGEAASVSQAVGTSQQGVRPIAGRGQADLGRQHSVDQLVRNFRVRGHIIARINPLGLHRPMPEELDPAACGLAEADLDRSFVVDWAGVTGERKLGDILASLRNTYCRSIGVQFMHIDDVAERRWLQERMERTENRCQLSRAEQVRIFTRLTDAVTFEEFIQKKFIGAKSFSLEGAETLIPLLDLALEKAGEQGADEVVIGMAHRGRLNVLANIIGKGAREIFREFEDLDPELLLHGGDVKYHQGYSGDWTTAGGRRIHLSLCFNPSHIDFIDPVAMGRVRAKQDRAGDGKRRRKLAVLIHGDAAFAGEGIVAESLNLSGLAGYTCGGTVHVVVDNQIGFTTPPAEGRSSTYSTDVARMLQIPIFHVNGEDPDAVAQAIRLAMEFRFTFQRDVVVEMVCYRRHGHNESDEPRFTQPLLYRQIDQRKSVRDGYLEHLLTLGELTRDEADGIAAERRGRLEQELARSTQGDGYSVELQRQYEASAWRDCIGGAERLSYDVPTAVPRERLAALLESISKPPADFHPHKTIGRFLAARAAMAHGERPVDWSTAEALALATLAAEGHRVRLAGQDTARGTFSQRHAVLHDAEDGRQYAPLEHLAADQGPVEILNSPLSEAAALGFEYGYSLDCPEGLVAWEAQFGDFANAAQVIIDQFIVSAQDKWCRLSGLVLLLPHGLEGQGAEHSSARLERFLALAADDNIQVLYPTTPAQYFHCLRRQVLRRWRKPMVVLTPKGLLRNPAAVSTLDELAAGEFQRVIPDDSGREPKAATAPPIKRILLCTGKLYYELHQQRQALGRPDVAIIRLEQLYPLPTESLKAALGAYAKGTAAVWVQEEPANMGAWRFIWASFGPRLLDRFPLTCLSRAAMTTPASGSAASHKLGQQRLIARAFEGR